MAGKSYNMQDDGQELNTLITNQGVQRVDTAETLNLTLHQCARDGNADNMARLLTQLTGNIRRKLNQLDEDKMAPLHYAARFNHLPIVKMLVEKGADANLKGDEDATPLHLATRYTNRLKRARSETEIDEDAGDGAPLLITDDLEPPKGPQNDADADSRSNIIEEEESVVDFLARRGGANVNAKDFYGSTPLHFAAMRGNEVAARDLIRHSRIQIEAADKQQMTALHIAATHDHKEIAKMLIDAAANLRCCDDEESTPLHMASSEGNVDIVRMLFDAGEKQDGWVTISQMVTDQNIEQSTALHIAVENSNLEVTKILLEKGADVNTAKIGFNTPLHLAAVSGEVGIVKLLVEHNARIDIINGQQATPLHRAAAFDHADVVEYLLQKGAYIEKHDKDNFTPLLIAACYGHCNTIQVLLKHKADLSSFDKNEKTAIFWAAEENKVDALKVLLSHPKAAKLVCESDRSDNEPLHIAAQNGYVECIKVLLDHNGKIDAKNEEEQTPLHLAAKNGHTNVVRKLVSYNKMIISDEDEMSNTALHLAALTGRTKVAKVLIEAGADIEARNCYLWTPLDCAATRGWVKTAKVLLDNDSPVDPVDKSKITPLHLASKNGYTAMVSLLIKSGADVTLRDIEGNNCLDLAIDNNQKDVAMAIIKSSKWKEALRNETVNLKTLYRDTPLRKLIRRMPDVAEEVFHSCTTQNEANPDGPNYQITFEWEFLDDMYADWKDHSAAGEAMSSSGSIYNEETGLLQEGTSPYTTNTGILKKNHPLNIMVTSKREDLLAHPLVTSLLHHKWNNFGRYFYYLNLILYCIFLIFLTAYVCVIPPPYTYFKDLAHFSNLSTYTCQDVVATKLYNSTMISDALGKQIFADIGKYVIITMACFNILRELFQFVQSKLEYIGWENCVEWITYVCSLLLVIDFNSCQVDNPTVREYWQWSLGAIAVFLAWMELVLFIRKVPRFGIYVVMFTDILRTFVQFFVVFFFIIIAFGLSFYMLVANQHPFRNPASSLAKTAIMMIGEFEFDTIFNSIADPTQKNDYFAQLFHQGPMYTVFIIFIILMSILIMNLLVGLAVDDIKGVQGQAILKRLAMQVDLALDVESILPHSIRRRFVKRYETVWPNSGSLNFCKQLFSSGSSYLSSGNIQQALDPELEDIEKVIEEQEIMKDHINKVRLRLKEMNANQSRLEAMMAALLQHHGIEVGDDDEHVEED